MGRVVFFLVHSSVHPYLPTEVKPCLCSTTQINTPTAQETLTRRVSWVPHEGVEKGKEEGKYEGGLGWYLQRFYLFSAPARGSESHNPEERSKPNRASFIRPLNHLTVIESENP